MEIPGARVRYIYRPIFPRVRAHKEKSREGTVKKKRKKKFCKKNDNARVASGPSRPLSTDAENEFSIFGRRALTPAHRELESCAESGKSARPRKPNQERRKRRAHWIRPMARFQAVSHGRRGFFIKKPVVGRYIGARRRLSSDTG